MGAQIVVIDYGMGNLRSVAKALAWLGASVAVTSDPARVARADKLILPGVGAFPAAMQELQLRGMVEPIKARIAAGTPYLGICLGLQLLFSESEEGAGALGLNLLPGRVKRFPDAAPGGAGRLKIPHMGWNQITRGREGGGAGSGDCPLLRGIDDGSFVYFVHSYYADPVERGVVALETEYGVRFPSMVWRGPLYATQFHPEKSQAVGLKLLENFLSL